MRALPNLYSLRFFLAMTVVLFHIPITSYNIGVPYFNEFPLFNKGLIAVNFFFSLSGFLIIRNFYLNYKNNNKIEIMAFYSRRIRRLLPVYFLVLILGIILYHLILPILGIEYRTNYNLLDLCLYYVFLFPNVFNFHFKVGGILNILWSVGVEEQFYLLFPLLFLLFRKNIKTVLLVLLAVFLGFVFFYSAFYCYRNFYFYFVLGGMAAVLAEEGKLNFLRYRIINYGILIVFILNFFTDWFIFNNHFISSHLFHLVISNLFIVSIAYFPLFQFDRLKINYFGQISYGIYMYHMFIVTIYLYAVKFFKLDELMDDTLLIIINNCVIIALTLFVAHLSYTYFERLFYKNRTGIS